MLAIILTLLLSQDGNAPLAVPDGGVCTGMAWVAATEADKLSVDNGPDFRVIRSDRSQTDWWGIYVGNHAQVSTGKKSRLFVRNGVTVNRVVMDGKFRGYLASNKGGLQNHFFGSPFQGDRRDLTFFERVDFGPGGKAKCAKAPLR